MRELEKGEEMEHEHLSTIKTIAADSKAGKLKPFSAYTKMIAADHLKEISDYYTRLTKMEEKAKGGKKEMEEDDERSDKAFEMLKGSAEKDEDDSEGDSEGDDNSGPSVTLERDGECSCKVGDKADLSFSAVVRAIEKTKGGHRVTYDLAESKE